MNKKLFLVTIIISSLLMGCSGNIVQQSRSIPVVNTSPVTAAKQSGNNSSSAVGTTTDAVDYNQYVKKRWIKKENANIEPGEEVYFTISKIENGKVTGKLSADSFTEADKNLLSFESGFEGTVNNDTAECEFNDPKGNRGNIKLVFKPDNEVEAAITLSGKSKLTIQPPEGTFEFAPYNIKDIKGFSPIENQSFMLNLNSWGNVKFVSAKLTAGNHIPIVFYLTNKDGDILYDFTDVPFPYNVDVKAVSFADVNKDGLKDIIIIAEGSDDDSGQPLAAVWLQKADGSFVNDVEIYKEINSSGNNKDIATVIKYLSHKF